MLWAVARVALFLGVAAPPSGEGARTYRGPKEVKVEEAEAPNRSVPPREDAAEAAPARPEVQPSGPPEKPRAGPRVRASLDEGFGVTSADGRFAVTVQLLTQMRYGVDVEDDDVSHGFELRLVRPVLTGRLWGERVTFLVQPELVGSVPTLLDATATVSFHPAVAVEVGQYRPWYTRGFPTPLFAQLLTDRGPVLDAFRVDRDLGLTLRGRPFDGRLEYYAAVLNGEGLNAIGNVDPNMLYIARVVAAPLGAVPYDQTPMITGELRPPFRLAIAANAYTNEVEESEVVVDPQTGEETTMPLPDRREIGVGGDVALQWDRLTGLFEGFWRRRLRDGGPDTHAWGAYGQGGVMLVRRRLELAMRVGVLELEDASTPRVPIEPGLNIYLVGNHAKLQLRYRCDIPTNESGCNLQSGVLQGQLFF